MTKRPVMLAYGTHTLESTPPTPIHTKAGSDTSKNVNTFKIKTLLHQVPVMGAALRTPYKPEELWSWVPCQGTGLRPQGQD